MTPTKKDKLFRATNGGFKTHINGLVVEIQFGYGSYSENKNQQIEPGEIVESRDAEIAVFLEGGGWRTREVWQAVFDGPIGDDVYKVGHCTIEDATRIVFFLADPENAVDIINS